MTIPYTDDEVERTREYEEISSFDEKHRQTEESFEKTVIPEISINVDNLSAIKPKHSFKTYLQKMSKPFFALLMYVNYVVEHLSKVFQINIKSRHFYHTGCLKRNHWLRNYDFNEIRTKHSEKSNMLDYIRKTFHTIPQPKLWLYPFFAPTEDLLQNGKRKPDLDSMKFEASRLASFANFPFLHGVYATKLASAGFYFTGKGDEVECFRCGLTHSKWNKHESPMDIHRKRSPKCTFLQENMTHILSGSQCQTSYSPGACGNQQDLIEADNRKPLIKNEFARPIIETANKTDVHEKLTDEIHMATSSQKREKYSIHEQLTSSFITNEYHNDTESLIRIPQIEMERQLLTNVNVIPSKCQGEQGMMQNNEARGNPFIKTTSFDNPKYPQYAIKTTRLDSFSHWPPTLTQSPEEMAMAGFFYTGIEDHCRCFYCGGGLKHWEPNDRPREEHARWYPHCAFSKQTTDLLSANIKSHKKQEKKEPKAKSKDLDFTCHPAVVSVSVLGYDQNTIKKAFEHLLNHNTTDINASTLLEAIFNLEEDSRVEQAEKPKQDSRSQTIETSGSQNQIETRIDPDFELSIRSLEEENQTLKDQQTCKICLDEPIAIVFLPCGHMASCKTCAPALRRCPICRAFIKGTVKAVMC